MGGISQFLLARFKEDSSYGGVAGVFVVVALVVENPWVQGAALVCGAAAAVAAILVPARKR